MLQCVDRQMYFIVNTSKPFFHWSHILYPAHGGLKKSSSIICLLDSMRQTFPSMMVISG